MDLYGTYLCNLKRVERVRDNLSMLNSVRDMAYIVKSAIHYSRTTTKHGQNKDVQRIVYSRCSPCFANRFIAIRCSKDLRRDSSLFNEHKGAPSSEYVHTKIDGKQ